MVTYKEHRALKVTFKTGVNEQHVLATVVQSVSTSLNVLVTSGIGYKTFLSVRAVALTRKKAARSLTQRLRKRGNG